MSIIPRQGWFFKLNFQNNIFRNNGKCKIGEYLLRQSHMLQQHLDYV